MLVRHYQLPRQPPRHPCPQAMPHRPPAHRWPALRPSPPQPVGGCAAVHLVSELDRHDLVFYPDNFFGVGPPSIDPDCSATAIQMKTILAISDPVNIQGWPKKPPATLVTPRGIPCDSIACLCRCLWISCALYTSLGMTGHAERRARNEACCR